MVVAGSSCFWQKLRSNTRNNTTLHYMNILEKFIDSVRDQTCVTNDQNFKYLLIVISNCKLDVSGLDMLLLVIATGISCEFQQFCDEVFKDSSKVNCSEEWSIKAKEIDLS